VEQHQFIYSSVEKEEKYNFHQFINYDKKRKVRSEEREEKKAQQKIRVEGDDENQEKWKIRRVDMK
jgi:hypothetical protein